MKKLIENNNNIYILNLITYKIATNNKFKVVIKLYNRRIKQIINNNNN